MITLSFLQLLQDNGFGVLDESLFFQKLTLDKEGIYISDIGEPIGRGSRDVQSFELYARGKNDIEGYKLLTEIRDFLKNSYSAICELPPVPQHNVEGYKNITLSKPSTITNVGLDANNRTIYSLQSQIIY